MAKLDDLLEDLVTANRILASQGIVDSFGHVSIRHPGNPQRYFLSRARAPERVEMRRHHGVHARRRSGRRQGPAAVSRTLHSRRGLRDAPDVMSVIHNHSPGVIPYGVTGRKMRPIMHMCGTIGYEVPIWDQHTKFGDTNLLVVSMAMGRDLAKTLGKGRTALMRGHGCVVVGADLRATVYTAVYLELNAKLQMQAEAMGKR